MMQPTKLRVLKPEPEVHWATRGKLSPRLDSLKGKKVAILRYTHISKSIDEDYLAQYVRSQTQAAEVVELRKERLAPWPEERLADVAKKYDVVIASSAQ